MANTVKVKMRCVALTPPAGGQAGAVVLVQESDNDVAKDNTDVANVDRSEKSYGRLTLSIADRSVAAGQFIKDQAYIVGFTETA